MARRKKKKATQFVEQFANATVPCEGNGAFASAMGALREYVAENLPYGTKVVVYPKTTYSEFSITLERTIGLYTLPCGTHLSDAKVSVTLYLSAVHDPDGALMAQVTAFGQTLARLDRESSRNHYAIERAVEAQEAVTNGQ